MIETHSDIALWKSKFFTKGYDLMLNIHDEDLVIEGYKTAENNVEFTVKTIAELDRIYKGMSNYPKIEKYISEINTLMAGWHSCDGLLRVPIYEMYATTYYLSHSFELSLENGKLYLVREGYGEDDKLKLSDNGNFINGFNSYYDRVVDEKPHMINVNSFNNERTKEMHTKMNEIFRLLGEK